MVLESAEVGRGDDTAVTLVSCLGACLFTIASFTAPVVCILIFVTGSEGWGML